MNFIRKKSPDSPNLSPKYKNIFTLYTKLIYYKVILWFYSSMQNSIDLVFTNSTWTSNHMKTIWPLKENFVLYLFNQLSSLQYKIPSLHRSFKTRKYPHFSSSIPTRKRPTAANNDF